MGALIKYSWPGNVRELENLVEMLFAYGKSPTVRISDLPERILEDGILKKPGTLGHEVFTLKEAERQLIVNALAKSKGNKRQRMIRLIRMWQRFGSGTARPGASSMKQKCIRAVA